MLNQRKRFVSYCRVHTVFALVLACICFVKIMMVACKALTEQNPKWLWVLMSNAYASIGTWLLAVGLAHYYAGRCIENVRYPLRTQLILATNLLTMLTTCLAPTALLVLIFGLVYMRHRDVRWAYTEVAKGRSVEDVLATTPPKTFGDERDDFDDERLNER